METENQNIKKNLWDLIHTFPGIIGDFYKNYTFSAYFYGIDDNLPPYSIKISWADIFCAVASSIGKKENLMNTRYEIESFVHSFLPKEKKHSYTQIHSREFADDVLNSFCSLELIAIDWNVENIRLTNYGKLKYELLDVLLEYN